MRLHVTRGDDGPRLAGSPADGVEVVNRFLVHLSARSFAPATVRAYAFDLLNFLRFCAERQLTLDRVVAADLFDYLDWQARLVVPGQGRVVRLAERRGPRRRR